MNCEGCGKLFTLVSASQLTDKEGVAPCISNTEEGYEQVCTECCDICTSIGFCPICGDHMEESFFNDGCSRECQRKIDRKKKNLRSK